MFFYFQQLPEPLFLYQFYNNFIGLAKECQRVIVAEAEKCQGNQIKDKFGPSPQMNAVIFKIKDLLRQLPVANYRTLRHLFAHLNKYGPRLFVFCSLHKDSEMQTSS